MATKTAQCLCQTYEFGTYDPDTNQDDTYTTECNQTTTKVFAQGHDAKLVGFLVRAELGGEEIGRTEGGMRISYNGAVYAAGAVSESLALKAQAQLDAAKARLAKKELAEARKASRKSAKAAAAVEPAPVPTKREAKIKIGRWTYDATIDPSGIALYNTKLGQAKSAKPGEYAEV